MAVSETSICNMALAKLGAKRINDLETDASEQAIHCRTHYEPTRDALLRSHWWRFAAGRSILPQDATDPDFEYDNQFILPNDFLALRSVYYDNDTTLKITKYSYEIEDERILTNEDSIYLKYTKKVTDAGKFDPLFVELLVLHLALKLVGPLAGAQPKLVDLIQREMSMLESSVRALDSQEQNTVGQADLYTWKDARY